MSYDDIHDRVVGLLRSHGDAAMREATTRANDAFERGDEDAIHLWVAVMKLIMRIESTAAHALVQ